MTLREWLNWKGLGLAEFGERIGRSAPTVSRIVRGIGNTDLETLRRIESATNGAVPVSELARKKSEDAA